MLLGIYVDEGERERLTSKKLERVEWNGTRWKVNYRIGTKKEKKPKEKEEARTPNE